MEERVTPSDIRTDVPTPARMYDYALGGKDNFAVDRQAVLTANQSFPEGTLMARENRRFLYRAVRYLAGETGIRQFLDLGSGYPTQHNVHQVAQEFRPGAHVVYVDIDPIVLVHARALLADNPATTVITADMTDSERILDHPEVRRLIDFDAPVAVLMFSIPHCIPDDAAAERAIRAPMERAAPGSHLALSHVVADHAASAAELNDLFAEMRMPWCTRVPEQVAGWLDRLLPVEPGLGDINDWRPDPGQPPLSDVAPELRPFLKPPERRRIYEYGGVLRKP